jgi:hypothetical protein
MAGETNKTESQLKSGVRYGIYGLLAVGIFILALCALLITHAWFLGDTMRGLSISGMTVGGIGVYIGVALVAGSAFGLTMVDKIDVGNDGDDGSATPTPPPP